ncbi:MAG: DUF6491 family protein [Parvularculaceae bacterium]
MRHTRYFALSAAAAALAALGAAGSVLAGEKRAADTPESSKADPRLGEEVRQICFSRSISGFRTIDDEDDAILLERGVNDWYKTTLAGACNYNQLRFAQSVAIDQRPGGGCITRGDALVFSDSAFGDFSFPNATRCIITEIYRWDPKAKAPEDEAEEDAPDTDDVD